MGGDYGIMPSGDARKSLFRRLEIHEFDRV